LRRKALERSRLAAKPESAGAAVPLAFIRPETSVINPAPATKEAIMRNWQKLFLLAAVVFFVVSCSPISRQVQRQALDVPFENLLAETDQYQGETAVLGGYIIQTRVRAKHTEVVVLQVPLTFTDRPRGKDQARGRFIVLFDGYLDPEVYARDRVVTVAGTVVGKETENEDICPYGCLVLRSRQIYLWPEERYYPPPLYGPFYDPFWDYPFYPYRRPFHPRHPFWGPRYDPFWGW
jgi:outer membrane lipoprotein